MCGFGLLMCCAACDWTGDTEYTEVTCFGVAVALREMWMDVVIEGRAAIHGE